MRQRSLLVALLAATSMLLIGCGGGGGGTVGVNATSIAINITPPSTAMSSQDSKTFTAVVTGTDDTAVQWSVQEPDGGVIVSSDSQSAVYTAPSRSSTYHIVASSRADDSKMAVAAVKVYDQPPPPP